jgi:hypothetical protein
MKTTTPEDVAVAGTDQDQSRAFARSVSTPINCCKQEEGFHRDASKEDHDAGGDTAAELSSGKPTPPPLREERRRGPSSDLEETRRVNAAEPTADARGGQRPTRPSRAQDPDLEAKNHIEQARQVHCGADERAPGKKIRAGRAATAAGTALLHRQLLAPARRRTGGKIGRPRGGQAPSEQPSARTSQSRRQPPEGFAHRSMPGTAMGGPVGRGGGGAVARVFARSPRGRRHGEALFAGWRAGKG